LSDFVEILQDDTDEGQQASKLELEVEFLCQGALFLICFAGISLLPIKISSPNLECLENGAPQRVEWLKCAFLKNLIWPTAAILNKLNRYN